MDSCGPPSAVNNVRCCALTLTGTTLIYCLRYNMLLLVASASKSTPGANDRPTERRRMCQVSAAAVVAATAIRFCVYLGAHAERPAGSSEWGALAHHSQIAFINYLLRFLYRRHIKYIIRFVVAN